MRPSSVAWFLLPPRRVSTMAATKRYYELKNFFLLNCILFGLVFKLFDGRKIFFN
jgi:hypothetical protein